MQIIQRNYDDIIYRLEITDEDGHECLLSDFSLFDISIFTSDTASAYTVPDSDIDTSENLIRVPSSALTNLDDGIIRLILRTAYTDSQFPDDNFDQRNVVDTCYFLKTY